MEVVSLHREIAAEDGETFRVCYALLREACGREQVYGVLCYLEGLRCRPDQYCRLPALLENRRLGQALLEDLAEREVMPTHLEEILCELMP